MVRSAPITQTWLTANSLVYMQTRVESSVAEDLSIYPVELAITSGRMTPPVEADWNTGEWASGYARIKVGPGGAVQLEEGSEYFLWARVTTPQEKPEIPCGPFYTYGGL